MSAIPSVHGCAAWQGISRIWWSQGAILPARRLHAVMRPWRWILDRARGSDLGIPEAGRRLLEQAVPCIDATTSWVLFLGNDSPYRKVVALLYGEDGGLLASAKAPVGAWARAALENEHRICTSLDGQLTRGITVPLPLHDGLVEAPPFVIQSGLAGDPGQAANWMRAYLEACAARGQADVASAFALRRARFQALLHINPVWESPVRDALMLLDRCEAGVTGQKLPWGLSHRDLRTANLLQTDGGVGIIDWEWGDGNWCPLADLRHFADNLPFRLRSAAMASVQVCGGHTPLVGDLLLLDKASIYLPATAEMGLLPSVGACGTIVREMQRTVAR